MADQLPTMEIFSAHDINKTTYPTPAANIPISVITPKTLKAGKHPVAVHIHGGYLVSGDSTFPPYFPPWLLSLSVEHSAVILSPDYRLLPSAGGLKDVTSDLREFWKWMHDASGLQAYVSKVLPGVELDFGKTLLVGGSAGGYGGTQLALDFPEQISSASLFYPMADVDSPFYRDGLPEGAPNPMHVPDEMLMSKEALDKFISETHAKGEIFTSRGIEDGFVIGAAAVKWGLFWKMFDPKINGDIGVDELPFERIKRGAQLPSRVWIVHGDQDSAVGIQGSINFEKVVKEAGQGDKLRLDIKEGKDHGFDGDWPGYAEWAKESQDWMVQGWLGN